MKLVKFSKEKKYIKDFLSLARSLYSSDCTQDDRETKMLLLETHPLSDSFEIHKFLVYDNGIPAGRFVMTFYKNDANAYIGLYECVDDDKVASFIFRNAADFAKEKGYSSVIGPVDCSFWIKYRLKTNMFDRAPYTGEPYNLNYYKNQFLQNDFEAVERYTSNVYENVGQDYVNEKFEERFNQFSSSGYEIKNLDMNDFEKSLTQVYYLLTDLYSDFPIYKEISLENFLEMFSSFKKVVDPSMVKLAYFEEKMVGFFISVPDYGNLTMNVNVPKLLKILKIRKDPKRYIMLYMGVDRVHKGLGKALAYSVMKELQQKGASGIGALTKEGKVTQNYASDLIEDRYEYVLYGRKI